MVTSPFSDILLLSPIYSPATIYSLLLLLPPLRMVATVAETVVVPRIATETGRLDGTTTAPVLVAIPTVLPQVKVRVQGITCLRRFAIMIVQLLIQREA